MTRPTVIYFGPGVGEDARRKVYFRALLFATGKRGRVVEHMYVRLHHSSGTQTFPIWVHGEGRLTRGSGLFVPENGVVAEHHFLLPADKITFVFHEGEYVVEVRARIYGRRYDKTLYRQAVHLGLQAAVGLADPFIGLYFDWSPDVNQFTWHLRPLPRGAA
jgi:hypothetical protein